MKEKISRNKISRHYKSFFGLENMGLGENDNLMIDWGESLVNDFCNQEVEKRIKERIPSEKKMTETAKGRYPNMLNRHEFGKQLGFIQGYFWLCSFMTKDGLTSSQKTEGGEG